MPDIRLLLAAALVAIIGFVVLQGTPLLTSPEATSPPSDQAGVHPDQSTEARPDGPSGTEANATAETTDAANSAGSAEAGDHGHRETSTSADASTHIVRMVSTEDGQYHFEPHVVRIEPGDKVHWVLVSGSHTTTAYHPANGDRQRRIPDGAKAWNSGFLTDDGRTSFEHTFTVEGVYDYFCIPHEGYGMVGSIVVGEATDGPGLSEPHAGLPDATQAKIRELNREVQSGSSSIDHADEE